MSAKQDEMPSTCTITVMDAALGDRALQTVYPVTQLNGPQGVDRNTTTGLKL